MNKHFRKTLEETMEDIYAKDGYEVSYAELVKGKLIDRYCLVFRREQFEGDIFEWNNFVHKVSKLAREYYEQNRTKTS